MKNLRKNALVKIVSLGLFVLLAGCSSDESAQNPIVTTDAVGLEPGVYTDVTILSLGDSITTGYNSFEFFDDSENENWSTGDARTDLRSHYQRLRDLFTPLYSYKRLLHKSF